MRKYAYAWITFAFFAVSFGLHWWFGWASFVEDAKEHGQTPELAAYLNEMGRDTFENWQSEFLQLHWQVVGLAYFLYVGSPSSKENDDRLELKIDALMRQAGMADLQKQIDESHYRHSGHAKPHPHNHAELT
jgi:hypothetical protein